MQSELDRLSELRYPTRQDMRNIIGLLRKQIAESKVEKFTPTNNESFQSLLLHVDDMVNCEECSDKDKVSGIRLILDEMRSETKKP